MTDIGFIGTGIMGRPMSGHLQKAGHKLFLTKHRSEPAKELIDGGATLCANARSSSRLLRTTTPAALYA